jgi:hypothetical protein
VAGSSVLVDGSISIVSTATTSGAAVGSAAGNGTDPKAAIVDAATGAGLVAIGDEAAVSDAAGVGVGVAVGVQAGVGVGVGVGVGTVGTGVGTGVGG